MHFDSVDEVQKYLVEEIFKDRADAKKAAGRALGTIQELLVYFLMQANNIDDRLLLEYRLPEYGYPDVLHNVEFSIHPVVKRFEAEVKRGKTVRAILPDNFKNMIGEHEFLNPSAKLVEQLGSSSEVILTNPPFIKKVPEWDVPFVPIARYIGEDKAEAIALSSKPLAFVECKRVGLEEGTSTGPQSIEKAKQAAYVALRSSRLQKIVSQGRPYAVYIREDSSLEHGSYKEMWESILKSKDLNRLSGIVRSCIFLGDYINWFPGGVAKKDIKVLQGAFDWLIWVNDVALTTIVAELITKAGAVREAFILNYLAGRSGGSFFTKGRIEKQARRQFCQFVRDNIKTIENDWLHVIEPPGETVGDFFEEVHVVLSVFEQKKAEF